VGWQRAEAPGRRAAGGRTGRWSPMEAWLEQAGLPAAVLLPVLQGWGVTAVDELPFIEEFDVEDSALALLHKRKLIAAIARITGNPTYADRAAEPAPAEASPAPAPPPDLLDTSVPGGARPQPPPPPSPGLPVSGWKASDPSLLSPAAYLAACGADGIPDRPNGLFPPGDRVLTEMASRSQGGSAGGALVPFQKHLFVASREAWVLTENSFVVGNAAAAERGIDLRCFYDPGGRKLLAAVRFGEKAMIGMPDMMSAHGGAVEALLDETTAELMKIQHGPNTVTRKLTAQVQCGWPCTLTVHVSQSD
jgi:hypothetical protein